MNDLIDITGYALFVLSFIYIRQVLFFYRGLFRLSPGTNRTPHTISVIIPARNEERMIVACLTAIQRQHYPKEKIQIIVVDDHSTDRTAEIVRRAAADSPVPIMLMSASADSSITSPKLRALSIGIGHSTGEIIATTDADCTAGPLWLERINTYFEPTVGIVTGPAVYERRSTGPQMFYGMQFLDFFSYTAVGAGAIGMGRVIVSLGSNMAFRRSAFEESGGFSSLASVNTGDDSLVAQNITRSGKWKARFANETEAVVSTQPVESWKEVLHQRMRWVGQTAYYPPSMMFFMICTFILFLLLFITIPLSAVYGTPVPLLLFLLKSTVDYLVMKKFTDLTSTSYAMRYFVPTALVHIPFVLIATIGGYFFPFTWKERTMTKESR